jgi:hypothetical protein
MRQFSDNILCVACPAGSVPSPNSSLCLQNSSSSDRSGSDSSNSGSSLTVVFIAVGAVGAFVLLASLVLLVVFWTRRRRRAQRNQFTRHDTESSLITRRVIPVNVNGSSASLTSSISTSTSGVVYANAFLNSNSNQPIYSNHPMVGTIPRPV